MSAAPSELFSSAVTRVLAKSKEIAAMPQVVFRAMEMANDESTSTQKLEQAVIVDPGFSAKILAAANSAAMGMPRKVTSIREAVGFLGFTRVKQIAMTVGAFDMFLGKTDRESMRRRGWWRHSVETAHVGKFFATEAGFAQADMVFAAGLLHILGKTLLCRFDSTAYDSVDTRVGTGQSEVVAERIAFGCDHVEIGTAAATMWQFPASLINAMSYLNAPQKGAPGEWVACFVAVSDYLVRKHHDPESAFPCPTWACEALRIDIANKEAAFVALTHKIIEGIVPMGG